MVSYTQPAMLFTQRNKYKETFVFKTFIFLNPAKLDIELLMCLFPLVTVKRETPVSKIGQIHLKTGTPHAPIYPHRILQVSGPMIYPHRILQVSGPMIYPHRILQVSGPMIYPHRILQVSGPMIYPHRILQVSGPMIYAHRILQVCGPMIDKASRKATFVAQRTFHEALWKLQTTIIIVAYPYFGLKVYRLVAFRIITSPNPSETKFSQNVNVGASPVEEQLPCCQPYSYFSASHSLSSPTTFQPTQHFHLLFHNFLGLQTNFHFKDNGHVYLVAKDLTSIVNRSPLQLVLHLASLQNYEMCLQPTMDFIDVTWPLDVMCVCLCTSVCLCGTNRHDRTLISRPGWRNGSR